MSEILLFRKTSLTQYEFNPLKLEPNNVCFNALCEDVV